MTVGIHILLRDEFGTSALHCFQCHLGQDVHLEEPLGAELRFNNCVCTLTVANGAGIVFHLYKVSGLFQHLHNLLAGHKAVLAYQDLGLLVEFAMVIYDFQHGQVVPEADFIVMNIVGRGNLKAAGTKIHLYIIVLNYRYLPVDERDKHLLALEPEVPFILRIDADCSIGHNGLRTGCSNDKELVRGIAVAVGDVVSQVIEVALGVLVDNLVVTHGGEGLRIPVHHAHALVNPTLLVEVHKSVDDCFRELRLHGETSAVPVAGAAEFAQLFQDNTAMLFFPLPCMLKELFTADILLADAHALKLGNNLGFGCNGCMVRSRYPASILAVHTRFTYKDVIEGIVKHVTHVKNTCHIGRWNHYSVRLFLIRFTVEKLVFQPIGIPLVLHIRCAVLCR